MAAPPERFARGGTPIRSARRARGACERAATGKDVSQRIATGATGVPVPPTKGSGIAESRKA
ncbi:hypothetical protein GCM10017674_38830 [Streptomyces gardneri]|nr:hypothetical protein GCM10017674_38830 [Streptomyces gardneri]